MVLAAHLLESFDWKDLTELEKFTEGWSNKVISELEVESKGIKGLTKERFNSNKTVKVKLADWLADSVTIMQRQAAVIGTFRQIIKVMKTEAIADKTKVIQVQDKLLQSQNEQLERLTIAVEETVQETVQKEIEEYSAVVKKDAGTIKDSLKNVVKDAIDEEDRSKNLIVFGLAEENLEDLNGKVGNLFAEFEEKPSFEATRIGRIEEEKVRPVKVTLRNSSTVFRFLGEAKKLKTSAAYSKVYISPDRSRKEQERHRQLVIERRQLAKNDPDRYYFILGDRIMKRDKWTSDNEG